MNYEVYRNTTLGNTLQEVLDDLIQVAFIFLNSFLNLFFYTQFELVIYNRKDKSNKRIAGEQSIERV
jgi:hypothetical protein